jgi:FdhE protein
VQRILEAGEIESLDHTAIPRIRLPQAADIFTSRAARLRRHAASDVPSIPVGAELRGYLALMAELVDAQAAVATDLRREGEAFAVDRAQIERAQAHSMPLLPALGARPARWREVLVRILDRLQDRAGAGPALSAVLAGLRTHGDAALDALADAVLAQRVEALDPALAPFVAAALQTVWTHLASQLQVRDIPYMETGTVCPVCGSQPVASVVRIGGASQGYRYLQCALCASEWHMVRVKCSHCEHNGKIAYHGLDGTGADGETTAAGPFPGHEDGARAPHKANDPRSAARAETCDDCYTYRKIFSQEHDFEVEPLADDLASLTLDVLVAEAGYERASINPLLWFGADQ